MVFPFLLPQQMRHHVSWSFSSLPLTRVRFEPWKRLSSKPGCYSHSDGDSNGENSNDTGGSDSGSGSINRGNNSGGRGGSDGGSGSVVVVTMVLVVVDRGGDGASGVCGDTGDISGKSCSRGGVTMVLFTSLKKRERTCYTSCFFSLFFTTSEGNEVSDSDLSCQR